LNYTNQPDVKRFSTNSNEINELNQNSERSSFNKMVPNQTVTNSANEKPNTNPMINANPNFNTNKMNINPNTKNVIPQQNTQQNVYINNQNPNVQNLYKNSKSSNIQPQTDNNIQNFNQFNMNKKGKFGYNNNMINHPMQKIKYTKSDKNISSNLQNPMRNSIDLKPNKQWKKSRHGTKQQ